ncbi:MAG TPA: hypothetical protein VGF94_03805 [Kofleriaceae bacterium]
MRWLLIVLVGCAAAAPPATTMPADVLARENPAADTSHNPTLWESSTGGCDDPFGGDSPTGGGGCATREGCGQPRGRGHGRGGGFAVLGAVVVSLRRRRDGAV